MTEPANVELAVKLIGIPNLAIPGADARKKQLKEISEIIKSFSKENPVGLPTEVDPLVDDHQAEAVTCKRYLISEDGQKLKRENPEAYKAVREHFGEHVKAAQEMAAQEPPPTKPLSESLTMAFKDMPPEAQAQILAKFGINLTPQDFMAKLAIDKELKKPAIPPGTGTQPAGAGNAGLGGENVR